MKAYTWYDFAHLSKKQKVQFLVDIKSAAERNGRVNLVLYNKYAEQYGFEKTKQSFFKE